MFTGIVETVGTIRKREVSGTNVSFFVTSPLSEALTVDQSLLHDGVCLTVTAVEADGHWVTAIEETLRVSCLAAWEAGTRVNLERAMPANGRFDGHVVLGHTDCVGTCTAVKDLDGSRELVFEHPVPHVNVEKGSIAVSGVSLTCFQVSDGVFTVAIIPYTLQHTNLADLKAGSRVNLEFDILGKYVRKILVKG